MCSLRKDAVVKEPTVITFIECHSLKTWKDWKMKRIALDGQDMQPTKKIEVGWARSSIKAKRFVLQS